MRDLPFEYIGYKTCPQLVMLKKMYVTILSHTDGKLVLNVTK